MSNYRFMKILLGIDKIYGGGGIGSCARDFIKIFSKEHQIAVVASDVPTDMLGWSQKTGDFSIKSSKTFLKKIDEFQPDLIINNSYSNLAIIAPFLKQKYKIISICHSAENTINEIDSLFNFKALNATIALSHIMKNNILERFSHNSTNPKISVIYNTLPRGENLIEHENNAIVFPGKCDVAKAPSRVIKILKMLLKTNLDFKFYWIGDTEIPVSRILGSKAVKDYFNDSRVVFCGRLPREEAIKRIQQSSIFLLPSYFEGCPVTLIEGIANGVVPIVSDDPHASMEIVQNEETGFVIKRDNIKGYAETIILLLKNSEKLRQLSQNIYNDFDSKFSKEQWVLKMNQTFKLAQNENSIRKNWNNIDYCLNVFKYKILRLKCRYLLMFRSIRERFRILKALNESK